MGKWVTIVYELLANQSTGFEPQPHILKPGLAVDSAMEQFNLLEGNGSFNDAHNTMQSDVHMTQAVNNGGKQLGTEEKKAAVHEEIKKVNLLPAHSTYATHRMRVLNKILQLLSVQRSVSQDEELELLFAGLSI